MGGHGYLDSSGIGRLFADELPSVTYEGENLVLGLQVARAALKDYEAAATGDRRGLSLSSSNAYLGTLTDGLPLPELANAPNWRDHNTQRRLLALRAALCVQRLSERRRRGKETGEEEWESGWESQKVAKAVVESYVASRLVRATTRPDGLLRRGLEERDREVVDELVQMVSPTLALFALVSKKPKADPIVHYNQTSTSSALWKTRWRTFSSLESLPPAQNQLGASARPSS
jgi:acyl-CoA oxidase